MSPHKPGGGWRYLSVRAGRETLRESSIGVRNRLAGYGATIYHRDVLDARAGQLASPALCSPLCRNGLQACMAGRVTSGVRGQFWRGFRGRWWQRVAARFRVGPDSHARGPVFESRCDH